ncbi:HTH-type transcriptional regulator LrpB [Brevibacillus agri]|uniref:HTH-type transcriptional regulator LrpB n=1 Tax=Brevibacillus agri TaxID=51101 RepID=A0A3M8AMY4_9BACL|nr:Lrp/AsnC family transcriptional regulator [Brevibacillus agri]QAV11385.1 transcriptional regulator [Brevibacillus agri]RNB52562.1 Lrp/AsnC family transcriptional regulator [Brevibacillus agri]GED27457.1 HTH-type transcriptional regulator LrpB [Brevibacillus agri]
MLDQTDHAILALLRQNSRLLWKDIGEQVHLSGQAVGNRIRRLEEQGVIIGYTTIVDEAKLTPSLTAMVTMFMKTTDHSSFARFVASRSEVIEAHRISGDGCYTLKINVADHTALNRFLDDLLPFGNYRVNLSIGQLK